MLTPGSVVGGYRIELLLGRGAMGEVYRAVQLALDRPVAVKRIAAHLLDQPGAVARFEREARCLARVHCENVVAVHDFGRFADEQGGEHWLIVMELVEGMSLGKVLSLRGRLPWPEAAVLARHIAEGLAAVADLGVVHRDLKPDNILISRRGVAKITDFGLARATDSTTMTAEGAMLGTPLYMPPEACRGDAVDARGDLYSLGCTWFHSLAGQPPYRASSSIALLRLHLEEPVPDVAGSLPDLPADLAALLAQMMAKNPSDRPLDASAVANAIAGCAEAAQLPRSLDVTTLPMGEQPTIVPTTPTPATAATMPNTAVRAAVASSTAITQVANASTTTVAAQRPGSLFLIVGGLVIAGLLAVIILLLQKSNSGDAQTGGQTVSGSTALNSTAQRRQSSASGLSDASVAEALQSGDTSLALQRAAEILSQRPGDAIATDLVRQAVSGEVDRLCQEVRHDDALARLKEHRSRWAWLDTGVWEKQIAIDQANNLVTQGRIREAFDAFITLRRRNLADVQVAKAIIAAFPEHKRDNLVMAAACTVLEHSEKGKPDPTALALVTGSMLWDAPFSPDTEQARALLTTWHPNVAGLARPLLDHDDYEARENGRALLETAGALSDKDALRYHWMTICKLTTTYSVTEQSLEWLQKECARPDWAATWKASGLKFPDRFPSLSSRNEYWEKLVTLIGNSFADDALHPAMRWTQDQEDEDQRWAGYRLLKIMNKLDRIDLAVFHARTLSTFEPLYDSPEFHEALAWCIAMDRTAQAGQARRALEAGNVHVVEHYRYYREKDNDANAATCKERIRAIDEALDRVNEP